MFGTGEANSRLGITELRGNNNTPFQRRTRILTVSSNEKTYILHDDEMKFRIQKYLLDL
jgi:hypothetical protein